MKGHYRYLTGIMIISFIIYFSDKYYFAIDNEHVDIIDAKSVEKNQAIPQSQNETKDSLNKKGIQFDKSRNILQISFKIIDQFFFITLTIDQSIHVKLILETGFGNKEIDLFKPGIGKGLGQPCNKRLHLGVGGDEQDKTTNLATGECISLRIIRLLIYFYKYKIKK